MVSLHLYLGLILLGTVSAEDIIQPGTMDTREGVQAELICRHPSVTTETIQWYRQVPDREPQHIISGYSMATSNHEASLDISPDRKSSHLTLQGLHPRDSTVYYCALNNAGYRVIFGAGTKVTVLPNIPDSSPSVYRLKPAGGSKAQVGPACLVTDFSPADNVTVLLNDMVRKRPATLVQSETQWSYGIVEWSSKPNDKQFECKAQYKEKSYNIQNDTNVLKEACSGTPVNESFKTVTDEKLNTLSLTVLALKIIFLKSIVFNLLMTVCLWIC